MVYVLGFGYMVFLIIWAISPGFSFACVRAWLHAQVRASGMPLSLFAVVPGFIFALGAAHGPYALRSPSKFGPYDAPKLTKFDPGVAYGENLKLASGPGGLGSSADYLGSVQNVHPNVPDHSHPAHDARGRRAVEIVGIRQRGGSIRNSRLQNGQEHLRFYGV